MWELRGDHKRHLEIVEQAARVANENSLPFLTYCLVPIRRGITAFREGRAEEGIPAIEAGLNVWHQVGGRVDRPKLHAILAEALATSARIDEALNVIDATFEQIERPG